MVGQRSLIALALLAGAVALAVPASAAACSGCGCRGGPGYRGPDGRCVGFKDLARKCGSPPTTRCAAEGPNAMGGAAPEPESKPGGATSSGEK